MLMAKRNMMVGGAKPWVNPYQTTDNALIAMWDGEWNVAGGVHDANATVWNDLIEETRFYELNGYEEWGEKYITKRDHSYRGWIGRINKPITDTNIFVETVVRKFTEFGQRGVFWSVAENVSDYNSMGLVCQHLNSWSLSGAGGSIKVVQIPIGEILSVAGYKTLSIFKNNVESFNKDVNGVHYGRGSLLGGSSTATGYDPNNGVDGEIYSIRLYSRELSEDERTQRYLIDKARFGLS